MPRSRRASALSSSAAVSLSTRSPSFRTKSKQYLADLRRWYCKRARVWNCVSQQGQVVMGPIREVAERIWCLKTTWAANPALVSAVKPQKSQTETCLRHSNGTTKSPSSSGLETASCQAVRIAERVRCGQVAIHSSMDGGMAPSAQAAGILRGTALASQAQSSARSVNQHRSPPTLDSSAARTGPLGRMAN